MHVHIRTHTNKQANKQEETKPNLSLTPGEKVPTNNTTYCVPLGWRFFNSKPHMLTRSQVSTVRIWHLVRWVARLYLRKFSQITNTHTHTHTHTLKRVYLPDLFTCLHFPRLENTTIAKNIPSSLIWFKWRGEIDVCEIRSVEAYALTFATSRSTVYDILPQQSPVGIV